MKIRIYILGILFFLCSAAYGQYEQYLEMVEPYLSEPIESGFFYFNTPNNLQPGYLYQLYRQSAPDLNNNMIVTNYHKDNIIGFSHYKYQQTYMNIPIEGAGCIEHYTPDGSLSFINAKVADSIKESHIPRLSGKEALELLSKEINEKEVVFAWEDREWVQQMKLDNDGDVTALFPSTKLIWAIDEMKDVQMIIPGHRYKLAYEIPVTYIYPNLETIVYYVDANNGSILKHRSTLHNDGPAKIYNYGVKTIDNQWSGGFVQKYILKTNDNGRYIHTKKPNNINSAWWTISDVTDADDVWVDFDMKETSTHYHTSNSWDFFYIYFGRYGQDNAGKKVRVKTQWSVHNAYFQPFNSYNELAFGYTDFGGYFGEEPSVVGHEYTHGVIYHTANLAYEFESGALNESFADIFGTVIQAKMLDGGYTDWILGNHVPISVLMSRSLKDPKSRGQNYGGNVGQPDTYGGTFWYMGDYNFDRGGVHVNSGVQNKWFYLLTDGDSGYNDHNDYYDVTGIGMDKSIKITYLALTSFLLSSSQYKDSREATIKAARLIFGDCSYEHISTANAWYAVGVGNQYDCEPVSVGVEKELNFEVFPNPTKNSITIAMPDIIASTISIYDITGRLIGNVDSSQNLIEYDVSHLRSGIYIIRFEFENSSFTKKLIIE